VKKFYFISDAHLGLGPRDVERAKETRLIEFFREIRNDAAELFIVGDLFDAWFEYRSVIPKGFHRLLAALDELTAHGIAVHYLVGNHDFWIRDYFRDELGMKTYRDAFSLTAYGKKVYLHHGDGVSNNDTGYKILKTILRNPFSIWLYSWLHPDLGVLLAATSSKKSRHYTSQKDYGEEDGMVAFARKKIDEGFDIVIMGHRHHPIMKDLGGGIYVNLGDWITHCSYAELSDRGITLKHWSQTTS
jgi:UDP-2,3-diacylglucosamine hydrolase